MTNSHPDPGIYRFHLPPKPHQPPRPAVFLDRDGVLIEETGYLHRVADIRFIPGALEAITALNQARIPVTVITNQAGVGRGLYGWKEFEAVQQAIAEQLAAAGGTLDGVWACAYHPEGIGPWRCDHAFRKPQPGMLLDAAQQMHLDLSRSWLVGDKVIDIEAAVNASLAGAVLVRTGYGAQQETMLNTAKAHWDTRCHITVSTSLSEAVERIMLQYCR